MEKFLIVDAARCTGCRLCEIACSLFHEAMCNPAAARLAVIKWPEDGMDVPIVCQQCEEAPCERVCQPGAIRRDGESHALFVDYDRCIGCRLCVVACPYGAMGMHPATRKVIKCDLCGGDPRCVKFCETQALRYAEPMTVAFAKKQAFATYLADQVAGREKG